MLRQVSAVEVDAQGRTAAATGSWGLDRLDQRTLPLDSLYNYAFDGANVDVYVVDSGVRVTHREFAAAKTSGSVLQGYSAFADGDDCFGHGTAVASVAAGGTLGAAPGANIVSQRACDCSGTCVYSTVIAAIQNAVTRV